MSYDIRFTYEATLENGKKIEKDLPVSANTTWNLREMIIAATGLIEWSSGTDLGYVKDVIGAIYYGVEELTNHSENYKQYESPNGWGTVKGCRAFLHLIVLEYEDNLKYHPDELEVSHFIIE